MTYFSINDLETFSGIKKHTIRIWEQRYAFLQPKRTDALRRVYSPEEVNLLLTVARLNQDGVRVSRIAKLIQEKKTENAVGEATSQLKAVHDLIIAMAEMDTITFENILNRAVEQWGRDEALAKVIFPFCDRIGLFDKSTARGYVENLLLVADSVKRHLYCGITHAKATRDESRVVMLFQMKGESTEMSMLKLHYCLKRDGYEVIYLGTPLSSIEHLTGIVGHKAPDFIVTPCPEKSQYRAEMANFAKGLQAGKAKAKLLTIGGPLPGTDGLSNYKFVGAYNDTLRMLLND